MSAYVILEGWGETLADQKDELIEPVQKHLNLGFKLIGGPRQVERGEDKGIALIQALLHE